jgi:hypothetical protein
MEAERRSPLPIRETGRMPYAPTSIMGRCPVNMGLRPMLLIARSLSVKNDFIFFTARSAFTLPRSGFTNSYIIPLLQ